MYVILYDIIWALNTTNYTQNPNPDTEKQKIAENIDLIWRWLSQNISKVSININREA